MDIDPALVKALIMVEPMIIGTIFALLLTQPWRK